MAAERILLAKIGAAHGVKGEVRVRSFGADPSVLEPYPLAAADGRRFEIERQRPAKSVAIVKFRGIDDRNSAEALNGVELCVERSALPAAAPDEFYHADLIGLAAMTQSGEPLGTVVAVHNFGAGDILDIAPQRGPSLLILFTKDTVPDIDIAAGRLVVVPPSETEAEEEEA